MSRPRAAEPTNPTQSTVKRLFAKSGNRCAFPGCPFELVIGKTVIAEICHIKGDKPDAARYDPDQAAADRQSFENLVLMCGTHHTLIDDDPEAFPVERLIQMKNDHERNAASPIANEIDRAVQNLVGESVSSVGQSGGITAHSVHLAINAPQPSAVSVTDRQAITGWAQQFHDERTAKITGANPPVAVLNGGILVLHLVPFSAASLQSSPFFDEIARNPRLFPPIATDYPRDTRIVVDGLITGSNAEGLTKPQRAYVHIFRSGIVEAVETSLARGRGHNFLMLPQLQAMLIKSAFLYSHSLGKLGIPGPSIVTASLAHVKGMRLVHDFLGNSLPEDLPYGALDQSRYDFDSSVLETIPPMLLIVRRI